MVSTGSTSLSRWHVLTDILNNQVGVEDLKDPHKDLLPSSNFVLIALRGVVSGHCTRFTLVEDLTPDLGHGPAVDMIYR